MDVRNGDDGEGVSCRGRVRAPLSVALVVPCRMDGVDGGGSGGGNGGSATSDPLATVSSEGSGGGASGGGATALPAVSTVYVTIPQAGTIVSGTSKSVSTRCSTPSPTPTPTPTPIYNTITFTLQSPLSFSLYYSF